MLKLHRLANWNLIWIENQGYWVHECKVCHSFTFERRKAC